MADNNDDDEGIKVAVVTHSYGHCWTTPLNNPDKNWRRGEIDTFDADDSADMDQCWNFAVPGRVRAFSSCKQRLHLKLLISLFFSEHQICEAFA